MERKWWKESTIYQIYPRSFKDSDGDGVGDLKGIIEKLPYLKELGIDIIWLSPIYKSPNDDNGYDISDYYDIMDEFGTMEIFDEMLAEMHKHGLKLMMDLVVNHTSDEHAWFEESRKSKDNPCRDYYIWRPPVNGGPPNNWLSHFSGPAWTFDEATGEYYLHLFTKKQPDLNWENETVRQKVYEMMRFWLDKGVDGFRMDVIPFISKEPGLPSVDWETLGGSYAKAYANGPRVHEFLQEMNREVLSKYDVVTVGEGPGISVDQANLYVGKDRKELSMIFHFDHMFIDFGTGGRLDPQPWDFEAFFSVFPRWDEGLKGKGWGSLYLGNHDFARSVSRWGNDGEYRTESAKLLAMLLFTQRGTPTIYQGDEIGMTNTPFGGIEDYRDVEMINAYNAGLEKGIDPQEMLDAALGTSRDHARTPVLWDDSAHGGFTSGEPWIMVNPNYETINVAAAEADPHSILSFYKRIIQFRKENSLLVYGEAEYIETGIDRLVAYRRILDGEELLVVLNFSDEPQVFNAFPEDKAWVEALSNYPTGMMMIMLWGHVRPWEGKVYRVAES